MSVSLLKLSFWLKCKEEIIGSVGAEGEDTNCSLWPMN